MTTGLVNISRHMGQTSCFSKFSIVFILQHKIHKKPQKKTELEWTSGAATVREKSVNNCRVHQAPSQAEERPAPLVLS